MKTIYYKDYAGEWVKDITSNSIKELRDRLKMVKKEKALNGQCEIFGI